MWNQQNMIKRGVLYDNLDGNTVGSAKTPCLQCTSPLPCHDQGRLLFWQGQSPRNAKKKEHINQRNRCFDALGNLYMIVSICRCLILVCSILLRVTSQKTSFFGDTSGGCSMRRPPANTSFSCIKSTTFNNLHGWSKPWRIPWRIMIRLAIQFVTLFWMIKKEPWALEKKFLVTSNQGRKRSRIELHGTWFDFFFRDSRLDLQWQVIFGEAFRESHGKASWIHSIHVIQHEDLYKRKNIWMFPKIGGKPQNGWFISWKPLLKWMIWGYPYSWKHTFRNL